MGFFENNKKRIIVILAILLFAVSVITAGRRIQIPIVTSAANAVVNPLQKGLSNMAGWFGDKFSSDSTDLEAENEQLKAQIKILEEKVSRLSLYEEENKTLSALLAVAQKYPEYNTTGVQVIAKDPGNWFDIFIIDKGTKDGISANMTLIDGKGLVGKVVEATDGSSKAQSILDSRSSISAMSLRTNDLGVVKGDISLMSNGLCRMEYIDADAEIIKGDEIVTSQLSNIYPPGISIGYVKEIVADSNGLTKYAIIEPTVDFKHLSTMLVITDYEVSEEVYD